MKALVLAAPRRFAVGGSTTWARRAERLLGGEGMKVLVDCRRR